MLKVRHGRNLHSSVILSLKNKTERKEKKKKGPGEKTEVMSPGNQVS